MTHQPVLPKVALVVAGGTAGHIHPGLAVATALAQAGWQVHWMGSKSKMEWDIISPTGIPFEAVEFSGVRGKSLVTLLTAPFRLLRACWQAAQVLRRVKPQVVLGFGGYITVPAGVVSGLMGVPLVLHEQNRIAGMANRLLAMWAKGVFTAFPDVLPKAQWVGNPLRESFAQQQTPAQRFEARQGPLKVMVVGGSLGAQALNEAVPRALAKIPAAQRPIVIHQSGKAHVEALQQRYQSLGVKARVLAFIDDIATAFAEADLVICRAGASTVTEVAAIGVPCLFVPLPSAVDDHQTANAQYLAQSGGAWLMRQSELNPEALARFIQTLSRAQLVQVAQNAYALRKMDADQHIVQITMQLAS
jgi:UDP-N-acetylglucosamine--N-acetylmuramyl-(pentapeptide) pyrophosphoryl-undecaprenol N-acetylglucosamine transferase